MEVRFSDYRFLPEQLILYKGNELIPLKHNQAQLLDFFLRAPEGIHSKNAIMDAVWQDKVVSEQVVFQTISQLRSILGNDAIKTFPKKGYQWQLPLLTENDEKPEIPDARIEKPASANAENKPKLPIYGLALVLVFLIIAVLIFDRADRDHESISLYLIKEKGDISASQRDTSGVLQGAIDAADIFLSQDKPITISSRQVFDTPKLIWKQAKLTVRDWLFWGETYTSEQGVFLHYGLSRQDIYWQGYLFAQDKTQLTAVLAERLNDLHAFGVFSDATHKLDASTLLTMAEIAPQDPDLLLLLAKHYIRIQHLDVALTYLEKLSRIDTSYAFIPYLAKAHWYRGKIYKMRGQHSQASNSLTTMSGILATTPLWPLKFHNLKTQAWLAYDQTDYQAMYDILEQGLELGREHADPLTLFRIHILYSILAKKAADHDKKYAHLNEAQAILLKHELADSNLAVVYYHFALFTQDNSKAIPYLERILELPRSAQNYWIQDSAYERLIYHYIEQSDFSRAHQLVQDPEDSPRKLLLKAKVFQAEQKPELALPLLDKAFEQARLNYDNDTGLQVALMLYRLSTEPKVRGEYLAYMESNASPAWLERHNIELAAH